MWELVGEEEETEENDDKIDNDVNGEKVRASSG